MALLAHSPEFFIFSRISSNPSSRNVKSFRVSYRFGTIGAKAGIKVGSEVKGCDVGVSKWDQYTRQHGQFATPLKGGSKPSKEEEERQNYYVNMGYAIRTLREEFPELFYRELSFDIYRDDIVFKDPLNTFTGIENYKSILWGLRFHGKIFFRALWVDIVGVWQPMESVIMVRWTVHGIPRIPWESCSRFDGTSEYKLDKEGKIYEHRVDNIALNSPPPKFRVLSVEELVQAIGCPSTARPTYFETSSSSSASNKTVMLKLLTKFWDLLW